ncbi:hypothetical protein AC579_1156 [Pseudocercospora musae]|uniref:Peroxidase n=1 Tax=Pseudocercospora musae TaxID=113226 RepID=A0A139I316_9PEZI|nr:hypothetical protein AC579_1156 [Pseudocercospora musae]
MLRILILWSATALLCSGASLEKRGPQFGGGDGPGGGQGGGHGGGNGGSSGCPSIWTQIASDLRTDFAGCNDLARSSIRFAFHDAAGYSVKNPSYAPASGGADGSLLLNDEEISRPANNPLKQNYRDKYLLGKYKQYRSNGISAADLVQFAGSVGIRSCRGGPIVRTVVGRNDTTTAAPAGLLPNAFGAGSDADTLLALWADKGISARELAALMGAHSTSRSFTEEAHGIPAGGPQDSTPGVWDVTYYREAQAQDPGNPRGVYRFNSDVNLANAPATGPSFTQFGRNQGLWATEFSAAMAKLSVAGIPASTVASFLDCTSLIL